MAINISFTFVVIIIFFLGLFFLGLFLLLLRLIISKVVVVFFRLFKNKLLLVAEVLLPPLEFLFVL